MTDIRDALRRASGVSESTSPDHSQIQQRADTIVRRRRIVYSASAAVLVAVVGFSTFQVAEGNWFGREIRNPIPAGSPEPTRTTTPSPPNSTPAAPDPIVVEEPSLVAASEGLRSPITVSGSADVYEANVSIRIRDADGEVIAETFTTATCGSGCRGDFSEEVAFQIETEQLGTIEVFSESAETGEPMHLVEIPVRLLPPAAEPPSGERAAIEVDSHSDGDRLTSPTIISGTANTFEANVRIRLLDADGKKLVDTFTTATCGSGCRGDYAKKIRFSISQEQAGTLQVFEKSAESGEMVNVVEIRVVLLPG